MKRYLKYGDHTQPRIIRVIGHNMARIVCIAAEIPLPEHLKLEFRLDNCSRIKWKRKKRK